jgi:hypothetical protein
MTAVITNAARAANNDSPASYFLTNMLHVLLALGTIRYTVWHIALSCWVPVSVEGWGCGWRRSCGGHSAMLSCYWPVCCLTTLTDYNIAWCWWWKSKAHWCNGPDRGQLKYWEIIMSQRHFVHHRSHKLSWDRTRAFAARGWRLTAWDMAGSSIRVEWHKCIITCTAVPEVSKQHIAIVVTAAAAVPCGRTWRM